MGYYAPGDMHSAAPSLHACISRRPCPDPCNPCSDLTDVSRCQTTHRVGPQGAVRLIAWKLLAIEGHMDEMRSRLQRRLLQWGDCCKRSAIWGELGWQDQVCAVAVGPDQPDLRREAILHNSLSLSASS